MHFVMMQFGVMQIFVKMSSGKTITLGVGASGGGMQRLLSFALLDPLCGLMLADAA